MTYTIIQYRGTEIRSICQTGVAKHAYTWFRSAARYMWNRQGEPMGFFDKNADSVWLLRSVDEIAYLPSDGAEVVACADTQ